MTLHGELYSGKRIHPGRMMKKMMIVIVIVMAVVVTMTVARGRRKARGMRVVMRTRLGVGTKRTLLN
jgi:hypothetical protein